VSSLTDALFGGRKEVLADPHEPGLSLYERTIREQGIPLTNLFGRPEYYDVRVLLNKLEAGEVGSEEEAHRKLYTRWGFVRKFGFTIPSREALKLVARFSPLLEVGAGSGYWAHELAREGADVLATDPKPIPAGGVQKRYGFFHPWHSVVKLSGRRAVRLHPDRTLLLCWPSYNEPWAAETLGAYRGDRLVYVGEWNGCCADDSFFDLLDREWEEVESLPLPHWFGIHDNLWVLRRKGVET
jgi:hypothetical protein